MIPRPIRWSCLTAFYPELCIGVVGQLYYVSRFSFGVINWPPDGGICTGVKRSVNSLGSAHWGTCRPRLPLLDSEPRFCLCRHTPRKIRCRCSCSCSCDCMCSYKRRLNTSSLNIKYALSPSWYLHIPHRLWRVFH